MFAVFGFAGAAFAANPQSVDYNVYVKPSLSISASTNTVTIDLNPNSKQFGSANLDVTVGTNNLYGYKLFMTTDNNATTLERDDTADSISDSIPTLSSSTTTSTFPANYWGYRINNDVGGTAGIIDTTGTNFYPYVPTNNPIISSATEATNEQTANLTFGAKIDYEKKAGLYELTLKFNALPIVSTYYMQDIAADPTLASTVCTEEPTVVLDKRDEQSYTIRRIGGDCWMVENLRFTGTTMDSTTSNVAPQYTPSNPYVATYYDLETDGVVDGKCRQGGAGDGYNSSCIKEGVIPSTSSPIGDGTADQTNVPTVWYNYAAATAGSITGNPNTDPQLYDVCPAGWRLPNNVEMDNVLDNISKFNLVTGGRWTNGTNENEYRTTMGRWWGSNIGDETGVQAYRARFILSYNTESSPMLYRGAQYVYFGLYVRCVMKDIDINNLAYMQDFAKLNEAGNSAKKVQVFNSMEDGESYQLKDIRESGANSYYVSKLKDGKAWMVQNLQLGKSGSSVTLTSDDSNISASSWTLNGKVAAPGVFATYTNCPTGTCEDRYTSTTQYNDNNAYYCTPVSGDTNQYVSCYYNWYSATASSGTSSVTPVGTSAGYKDVGSSICPKGWYLPSGGGVPLSGSTSDRPNSDFNVLYNNYPSAAQLLVNNPTTTYDNVGGTSTPGFLLTGTYYSSGASRVGDHGNYWSRSAYSKGFAYFLNLSSSAVDTQLYRNKYYGFAVRCVTYPN